MDRFISTITGTISTLFGGIRQGRVVVGVVVHTDRVHLHARSLWMRLTGAMAMGWCWANSAIKPSFALATAWQQPWPTCRRVRPASWRSATRSWADGERARS